MHAFRELQFFARLSETLLREVCSQLMCREVAGTGTGETAAEGATHVAAERHKIVTQGEHGEEFFVLISGQAVVTQVKAGESAAQAVQLATFFPGSSFGEMAVLEEEYQARIRTATITATEDCVLAVVTREVWLQLLLSEQARQLKPIVEFLKLRTRTFASPGRKALLCVAAAFSREAQRAHAESTHSHSRYYSQVRLLHRLSVLGGYRCLLNGCLCLLNG